MQKSLRKLLVFGKELSIFTGILLVLLFVFSCNNMINIRGGGNLIIAIPGARAATASSFTIELTGSNGTTQNKTVSGGSTVQFDDLAPDTYRISVKAADDSGAVVLSGSAKATVVAGETATVTVDLESALGKLAVEFTVPAVSTATSYTVEITHSEDKEFSKKETISDGTSVLFNDLIPGSYTISVQGMNASTVVLSGTAKATVVEGQPVTATVNLQDKIGKLSVEFTVPDDSTATSYTVEITDVNSVTQSKPVSDGTSALFEGLIPGLYSIRVEGKNTADDTGTIVLSGTAEATVVEGQTVTARVPLQEEVGRLSVEFTVPGDSTAISYTVKITHSEDKEFSKEVTIPAGSSVPQFNDLIPGSYTIRVEGKNTADDTGTIVLSGTATETVVEGQTVTARVPLQEEVGRLSVEFTVPDGSTATSFTVEISDSKEFSESKPVAGGSTVQFDDLAPDTYNISVKGNDASGLVVLYGTTTSNEVAKGTTATATVSLAGIVNTLDELETAISKGGIVYVGSDIEINEPITAAPNQPVTIQAAYKDVILSCNRSSLPAVAMFEPTGGNWTFGGGEHSITLKGNSNSSHLINITSAEVTLASNGSIEINSSYDYGVAIGQDSSTTTNKSVFHLDGGKIIGRADTSVVVYGNSQFIMKNGSITATASVGVLVNAGSVFSMTGGDILNSTNDVIVENSGLFTISGKVQVGTIKLNGIGNYFTVGGELEGNSTVATITPGHYLDGDQILNASSGVDLAAEIGKFKVTPQPNGTQWAIVVAETDAGKVGQLQSVTQ